MYAWTLIGKLLDRKEHVSYIAPNIVLQTQGLST